MIDPEDPPRLLDAPDAPAGLRSILRAAEADLGTDQQLARLAGRLGPLLGPGAPAAVTAKVAATTSGAFKLGLTAVALLGAAGGAWLLSTSHPETPPPAASPVVAPPVPPSPAPVMTTPAPEAAVSEAPPPPAVKPVEPLRPSPPSTKPAPPSEADLLEQARSALKSDPSRALARANEAAQRYPRGVLVQEREVLAIQALRRLGRAAEADARAQAFAKAFPGSAFARKLGAPP